MYVSAKDIALKYGVSVFTIYRLREAKVIPSVKIGKQYRFVEEQVDRALKAHNPTHGNQKLPTRKEGTPMPPG